jgi:hypothetical protein
MKRFSGFRGAVALVAAFAAYSAFAGDWTVDLRGGRATARGAGGEKGLVRRSVMAGEAPSAPELAPGDTVTLLLFGDTRLDLRLDEAMEAPLSEGRVFTATLAGGPGLRTGVVIAGKDGLTATVAGVGRGNVVRVFREGGGTVVEERDPVAEPSRGGEAVVPPEGAARGRGKGGARDQSDQLVDVLVAYEKGARDWVARNGGMTNFAETAVQRMNAALANTGLDKAFRYRLVGVMGVDATVSDIPTALDAACDGNGAWSAVHAKRDEVGADIVSVLIDNGSSYGTTGQGFSLGSTNASGAARFSESAYNACLVRSVAISDTMTHETGHNMGCGHSNTQTDGGAGPQSFPYSSGYHFVGTDGVRYHTIMAYYTDGTYDDYSPVPLFSSPDFEYAGVPVGTSDKNDNTRVLRQTFKWAGAWRERKIPLSYDVFFSPVGGTVFSDSLTVTLAPGRAGLPIRYTLDGSAPTLSSPLYSGPITITRTTTIRAATVTDGILGPAFEATYSLSDLGDALDAPQLAWTTNPDCPWTFVTDETWDGTDAAQSSDDGSYSSAAAWLSTTVEGPAAMSFRYKIRTYTGTFSVLVDGAAQFEDSRDVYDDDWHLAAVTIPDGTHAVKFVFKQGGRYDGFNGAWLDAISFAVPSRPPVLSPATTTDPDTATTFERSLAVTLAPPDGASGAIYYTLDGSAPDPESSPVYTAPILLTATTRVRAVFVEDGKGPSAEISGLYRESHPVEAGEWTTDAEGAKTAAARDGRLVAVLLANRAGCWWSQQFYPVAESPDFLAWAKANGIYLVTADSSCNLDTDDAYAWFRQLYRSYGDSGSIYYPTLYFALPSAPTVAIGKGLARNDGSSTVGTELYLDTVDSLVAGFASVLGETVPLPPAATPASTLVDAFPLQVALSNPNSGGTLLYTLDGTSPTPSNGKRYTAPVTIPDASAVLRAAVWPASASGLSSPVFVGDYKTVADVFGTSGIAWTRSGNLSWRTEDGESATLRAGGLGTATGQATLSGTVTGKGKLVFSYQCSSYSSRNSFSFAVDGTQQWKHAYDGTITVSGTVTNEVGSVGTTTFTWTLSISDADHDFNVAGAWLSGVRWIPERDGVEVEGVFMDAAWFEENFPGEAPDAASREALAREDTDGDGFANWAECLCGTDPNDARDCLRATIRMEGGKAVVGWNLSAPMEGAECVVEGVSALPAAEGEWTAGAGDGARFFRVRVGKQPAAGAGLTGGSRGE